MSMVSLARELIRMGWVNTNCPGVRELDIARLVNPSASLFV
jgi:hypothetical protein